MFNRRVVFWSACMGMLLFGIALISLGSIAPDLKEKLSLDDFAAGTLFSILPFGILTGSLLFGPVADKYGYKILVFISCILLSAGFEGIAFTESSGLLKAAIFLIGLAGGAINGATNALVSDISGYDKTANISLLGVFFGIGALGMPLILGILGESFRFEKIVAAVGILSFLTGILFAVIKLPPPKIAEKIPVTGILAFFKDKVLILIAVFLFFQSSFEGLMNNWTTTYLADHLLVPQDEALYGLSLFVAGMVIMRLITGTILRNIPVRRIMIASLIFVLLGIICIKSGISSGIALTGFMLVGAGLASGFPVMLGLTGARYVSLSGSAFSFVLTIALLGNMLINYCMGVISMKYGISHLITITFAEMIIMAILGLVIVKKYKG
ncbi:MAG: major facilitator superfamily 1 [Bacteroidetes bacterium]|nr:major facilitator superfamily 1 [Bacteroidota bacterium]